MMFVQKFLLPLSVATALSRLGEGLDARTVRPRDLAEALALLGALPPQSLARADREIAELAHLYRRPVAKVSLLGRRELTDRDLLAAHAQLAFLFLFHRDGREREAALDALDEGAPNPFFFAAIVWRLNDWAVPVRAAAKRCAARVFVKTDPAVIAQAAPYLLDRKFHWRRWKNESAILDETLSRTDVIDGFADLLSTMRTGPAARLLRLASQWPAMDRHLPDLAKTAFGPAVRAVALQALIARKATWPAGFKREWIEKTFNRSRLVMAYAERDIAVSATREVLIVQAARDRSAVVRRVAAAALVDRHRELANTGEVLALLAGDASRPIRERVDFVLRVRAQ